MKMKLQEVHPALVHFPIALLPLALGADALGKFGRKDELSAVGRWGITAAAGSALVAGLFGLIAQEEVSADGEAMDMLITHRDLNLGAVAVLIAMAVRRSRRRKPTLRYLASGLAALATVTYSAYLGGRMVYGSGVGVEKAGGAVPTAPTIGQDEPVEIARRAARDLGTGSVHLAKELAGGQIVPSLTGNGGGA